MFSILILTQDEELNLAACLDSVSWCDDVWILDSGSTDKTLEIAAARNCHIMHRKFDNFGDQRNYAIDNARFKHDWVFDLDADERFTPELKAECDDLVRKDEKSAYYVANKMMLLGKWIKHASQFPVYQMRFHKLGEIRFLPHGHGQRESAAKRGLGYCRAAYIHYNFSKGLGDWFQKHARYALREAEQQLRDESASSLLLRGQQTFRLSQADPTIERRRKLKRLVANLPCRSWIKFFYLLFVKRGLFDGPAGWLYCRMQAHYEFMCTAILTDLRTKSHV